MNMRKRIAGTCLGTGLILLLIAGSGLTAIAGSDAPYNATLKAAHENTAFADATLGSAEACDVPGMLPGKYYWHFVIPDNDQSFVSIEVTFATAGVVTDFFSHPTAKHAYVATDTADTLVNARAVVTPGIDGDTVIFNLSHVCAPAAPPVTTTLAPTTTAAPTTTTIPTSVSPTSIVAPTTTTIPTSVSPTSVVAPTTTAAPTSVSPTSIVASTTDPSTTVLGVVPATAARQPTSKPSVAPVSSKAQSGSLAQTGSRSEVLALLGCLSLAAGIAMLAAARRTSASS